jgi:hypothetical protein
MKAKYPTRVVYVQKPVPTTTEHLRFGGKNGGCGPAATRVQSPSNRAS